MNLFDLHEMDVMEFHKRQGKKSDKEFFHSLLFPDFSNTTLPKPDPKPIVVDSTLDEKIAKAVKNLEEENTKKDKEIDKLKKKTQKGDR